MFEVDILEKLSSSGVTGGKDMVVDTLNQPASGRQHDEFFDKMNEISDEQQGYVQIGSLTESQGGQSLSDHLFSAYDEMRDGYEAKMNSLSEILSAPEVTPEMTLQAKQEIAELKFRTTVAIKSVEKSMETFNMLLKMQ